MAAALTEHDVAAVRGEVAAGRPVTVWFTPAAVGVPVGGSAKVVAVDDVAEGEFIQVRRTGSRDTMFCSPAELTRTRPPRRRAGDAEPAAGTAPAKRIVAKRTAGKPPAQPAAAQPAAGRSAAGRPAAATPAAGKSAAARPAAATPAAVRPAAAKAAADGPAAGKRADDPTADKPVARAAAAQAASGARDGAPDVGAPEPAAPARAGTARGSKRRATPAEVRVGLVATPEGEWSVEVHVGARRVVAPTPVPAADVAVAARALPAAVAEVVSATLEQARRRQHERVEQLRAELEAAQRALEQLAP